MLSGGSSCARPGQLIAGRESVERAWSRGGFIHQPNWQLPGATVPAGAEKKDGPRVASGEFTPWFDLAAHAGKHLHGRHNRSGGIAEFPNVTARFVVEPEAPRRAVEI